GGCGLGRMLPSHSPGRLPCYPGPCLSILPASRCSNPPTAYSVAVAASSVSVSRSSTASSSVSSSRSLRTARASAKRSRAAAGDDCGHGARLRERVRKTYLLSPGSRFKLVRSPRLLRLDVVEDARDAATAEIAAYRVRAGEWGERRIVVI